MRTNREGNLKRFFDIQQTDFVLEVRGEALPLREAEYDYIFWNPSGAKGKEICVQNLYKLLAPTGKLVVYFDNPFGLHAFSAGTPGGEPDVAYPLLETLKAALKKSGEVYYDKCYYPYPNVEFPCVFFSDERLPGRGECEEGFYNFESARMEAFDERSAADHVVAGGMYPYLANAYMLILSKTPPENLPVYTRFSNERREDAKIRTDLYKDRVCKCALGPEAERHVMAMQGMQTSLRECLQEISLLGRPFDVNQITEADEEKRSISFVFVSGQSLEQTLDTMLQEGKEEEVSRVLLSFCKELRGSRRLSDFAVTKEFEEVFGEIPQWQSYQWKSLPVSDIDLVAQNILLADRAVVIDYEWTFAISVPVDFLIFRFLYFYLEAKNRACVLEPQKIYEQAGITPQLKEVFLAMETAFQHYVQHGAQVLCNSYDREGKPVLTHVQIEAQVEKLNGKTVQIVGGDVVTAKRSPEGVYLYKLPKASEGMKILLDGFDATENPCVLRLGAMADRGGAHTGLSLETNGMHFGGLLYLFEKEIPQVTIHGIESGDNGAEISVEEIEMSQAAIRELKTTIADMRFIIDNREQQIRDLKNSASWKVTKPLRALKGNKEE